MRRRKKPHAAQSGCFFRLAVRLLPVAVFTLSAVLPLLAQESAEAEKFRALALDLTNKSRAESKLPPLQIGREANEAAKAHAADMLKRNFYSHNSPEGKTVQDRYMQAGGSKWRVTAENIARCTGCQLSAATVEDLHRGWMNSKGHRENLLRRGIAQFGFSIVAESGQPLYAVQAFAGPGIPNGLGANEDPKRLSETEVVAKALEHLNRERKQAGLTAFSESAALNKAARSLLPERKLEAFDLAQIDKVMDALPAADRKDWQSLTVLAGACGGCGAEPTAADVRSFVQQWLGDAQNKGLLLSPGSTHLGFALAASGQGKKVALGVLGKMHPR